MTVSPTFPNQLRAHITLPTSKSLCARAVVVNRLAQPAAPLEGLSDCDDTQAILRGLSQLTAALESAASAPNAAERAVDSPLVIDIGAAGTAMRFLTALLAATPHVDAVITGSQRMQERPIAALVDALRQAGAHIDYAEREGFPPLRIRGTVLEGGAISIPAHISSQYISALLMIAPTLRQGLRLQLVGNVASSPYIHMTLQLMREFGVATSWEGNTIVVPSGQHYHRTRTYRVEGDWSAASYWYEIVALSSDTKAQILLQGLTADSTQGDAICAQWFASLGVRTTFLPEGALLEKSPHHTTACSDTSTAHIVTAPAAQHHASESNQSAAPLQLDFSAAPDLAQTFVVTCALLRRPFVFSGLESLRIKETDRIAALVAELQKLGKHVVPSGEGELSYSPANDTAHAHTISIATYDDHRMALAFAPVGIVFPHIVIAHPEVVRKSYPTFWQHLQQL